ncbi:MAG: hypothetical protein HF978_17890 [Desulfobacteraceae bacterium]|nr:hypothetical protein [Desulfobacteraceae bacterium]MBC2757419.1 hypothetical protein [Desulfobacteraceae bacterium]MBC2763823.1 hypothetical protein [ANME-2 cluster archaeon]
MKKFKNKDVNLPPASSLELTGMQSVRATFKLSKRTIKTINVVAAQLGIRQKSLFDHLMDDAESLKAVADEIQQVDPVAKERIHKTYVISRKSLTCLEKISQTSNAPRDILIEYSVQRLMPIIEKEQEKQKKRKEIVNEFRQLVQQGQQLLEKSGELLDEDDAVFNRLASAIVYNVNAYQHMAEYVKKGEGLDDYSF